MKIFGNLISAHLKMYYLEQSFKIDSMIENKDKLVLSLSLLYMLLEIGLEVVLQKCHVVGVSSQYQN